MIDDLPDDLAALVSAERAARPSPETHARVRAKLAASAVVLGAATVTSTSAAAAGKTVAAGTGLATKLVVVLTLVVGGTTAAVVLTREKSSPTAPAPSAARPPEPTVSTMNAQGSGDVPELRPSAVVPSVTGSATPMQPVPSTSTPPATRDHVKNGEHARVASSPAPSASIPTLSEAPPAPAQKSEAETVAQAWRTLATDPEAALVEVESISGNTLVEEREAIRCVALAHLHRPEAADAITQFLSAHPRSVHRALVESAQKGLP